jgi:hypothetical protein
MRTRNEIEKTVKMSEKQRIIYAQQLQAGDPKGYLVNEGFLSALKWVLGKELKQIEQESIREAKQIKEELDYID